MLALALLWPSHLIADTKSDSLTAALLYRLAEKIQWPNQKNITQYHYHIVAENKNVYRALKSVAKVKTLKGSAITISYASSEKNTPKHSNIIFISAGKKKLLPKLFSRHEGKPILIITEESVNQRLVMINLIKTEDKRPKFEVNKANIINQNLGIHPDIILLGGTEIDMAQLYKEGLRELEQQSLVLNKFKNNINAIREEKEQLSRTLTAEKLEIDKSRSKLEQTRQKMAQQNKLLQQTQTEVTLLQETTLKQNKTLLEQEQHFHTLQRHIQQQKSNLSIQTATLETRESKLHQQQTEIDLRKAVLEEQSKTIQKQDVVIDEHKSRLLETGSKLASERQRLIAVSFTAILVLILSIALFVSNRLKKQTNVILNEKKRQLEESTVALAKAKKAAENASSAKSSFLASMSHELRTPLNSVLGFSQLLQQKPDTSDSAQQLLRIINNSGEHLLSLINDVLDMSKIEAGRAKLELEAMNLKSLISDIINMMRHRAQEKNILLVFEHSSDFPRHIKADAAKLRQVLINLLGNAIKFTDEGSVTLTLDAKSSSTSDNHWDLHFKIEDTGIGISSSKIDSIFRPFEQAGDTPINQQGTGLGLTISGQFIQLMGGRITVDSTEQKGSVFEFNINIEELESSVVLAQPDKIRQRVIGLDKDDPAWRILIVEDANDNRLLLNHMLTAVGFTIREAVNGEEAIKHFQQWKPHFIWMDMLMPVMNGYQATSTIRNLPDGDKTKIVALTASAYIEQRQKILSAGCNDVVYKPYIAHQIFDAMAQQLGVHYVYDKRTITTANQPNIILTSDMLKNIPPDLINSLKNAAQLLDLDLMNDSIKKISDIDTNIANGLQSLSQGFCFGQIQALLDEV